MEMQGTQNNQSNLEKQSFQFQNLLKNYTINIVWYLHKGQTYRLIEMN